jgi:hypothetical protein
MSWGYARDFTRDDPAGDWDAYMEHCDAMLEKCPVCCKCGQHIQDAYLYRLDGDAYCDECASEWLSEQKEEIII